ncbi:hypothetical protein NQZ79_g3313 [Umbelopsis isabellina]|nr:hypothetical protein NQZ79_g3313 [Umbelopsis isabellina]
MKFFNGCLAGALALASIARAANVTLDWDITYSNANPDGLFERRVIGVNGAFPPPHINVTINDTLIINTHNSLDVPTSLHAHGMFQNGTAYMDGPVGVTECGIPPDGNFTYVIPITQKGTFWIHSHYRGQYMDGLRSALILNDPVPPYHYDEDLIVTMNDWYHDQSETGLATFLNVYNPTGAEPVPNSGLINNNANTTFNFVPGKTYRLRLINMSALAMFFFSIDNHTMDIIEVEGIDTQRQTVDNIFLAAAQRYSVLVTAKNDTSFNYYMHADMNPDMFDTVPDDLQLNITAPIIYNQNAPFAPQNDLGSLDFDDTTLVPLEVVGMAQADHSYPMSFDFQVYTDGINRGAFNDLPYLMPKTPSLLTALTIDAQYANDTSIYGPQGNAIIAPHLSMMEFAVNNLDSGAHPFHLHGHVFQVVARGDGVYNASANPVNETQVNPVRRDTVHVPAESYAVIRWRADNPAVWFFHCHVEWHLESGLAAQVIEAPELMPQRLQPPQQLYDNCKALGWSVEGNAAGKQGLDVSGAPSGVTIPIDGFTAKGKGAMAACIISALLGMGTIVWYAQGQVGPQ